MPIVINQTIPGLYDKISQDSMVRLMILTYMILRHSSGYVHANFLRTLDGIVTLIITSRDNHEIYS